VNALHHNGFSFNQSKAEKLLEKVKAELVSLDDKILKEFPPKEVLIREFTPKATKFGTISKTSVPRSLHDRIHEYEIGQTYRHTKLVEFNPSSHKQIIGVLTEAGWRPTSKTKTHIDLEREITRLENAKKRPKLNLKERTELDLTLKACYIKRESARQSGWKVNEENLLTLPDTAPSPARALAKRILLEARRRTLTEWLGLVHPEDQRIRGKFVGLGAWTHRMAHQNPNTANIPTEAKLYGKEMRSLWIAPRNRLLVGVDAEGIQLRIFAHYINDPEFTDALVKGKKDDKTDPHSLNQRILGDVCKSRQTAKRFIYALLLGAGLGKLGEILECSQEEAKDALSRLIDRYRGFKVLKETIIPQDGKKGWFTGLDGRIVRIPGDTAGARKHLAMSGYLQNGEAIIMKKACVLWSRQLQEIPDIQDRWKIVNFVHDEWQTEVPNDVELALRVAKIQADSLRLVGEELKLKCPLAGSYWNDDLADYTIGPNWAYTH
jgi:DNA polymerase I-like protein with 3'-5' exonuclease and polymerase domains